MSPELINALIGLLGASIGSLVTYWLTREKYSAEVEKLKAETEKIKVEAEKTRAELREKIPKANEKPVQGHETLNKISVQEFLNSVDFSQVRGIYVLGHTGRRIYDEIHERLRFIVENKKNFPEEIRILIRTPLVEGWKRNNFIQSTLTKIHELRHKRMNIDARFYEAVPAIRGIICEYHNKNRIGLINSYYWPTPNQSRAFDYSHVVTDTTTSPRHDMMLLESWIDQYWGRDEVHTVVFDFDDTLASTGDIQVKAWTQVIDYFLRRKTIKIKNLSDKLKVFVSEDGTVINVPALLDTVKAIFVDKQLAEAISQDLFVNISDETLRQINEKRFEIRESMMDEAKLFDGVGKLLKKLGDRYNFAIISSTDERMISDYLDKKDLQEYFPLILGKYDPGLKIERENIHRKASLLIKLSEIIGIPLSRLVYIGDNNSDYLATRQLGVTFIEARQAANLMGVDSFIQTLDSKPPLEYFSSYEKDELPSLLNQHSQNITRNKYRI